MTLNPAATGSDPGKTHLSIADIWAEIDIRPWPAAAKVTGLGVVLAESGGKTNARNTNRDGSVDRGMWQFNSRAHPEVSDSCADDPDCATQHAYETWKASGGSFRQWATFNSGAAKKALTFEVVKQIPDATSLGDDVTSAVGGAADKAKDALTSVPQFLSKLGVIFDPAWWVRFAKVIFGAVAVAAGVVYIGKNFAVTQTVGAALKGVAKSGE